MKPCVIMLAATVLLAAAPALNAAEPAGAPAPDARLTRKDIRKPGKTTGKITGKTTGKTERWRLCGSQRTMKIYPGQAGTRSGTPRCVPLR